MQEPSSPSPIKNALGFLVPIGFVAIFLIGIPLGYKLVLGGRKSTVEQGTIQRITLIHQVPEQDLIGKKARIVSDYIIIELKPGQFLWIPETNIAGIEFQQTK